MYYNIFKRIEGKYLLTKLEKEVLLEEIKEYLREDVFFESTVCNIYYDNDNQERIIRSLEKQKFKNKVRIRSYGIPTLEDEVFLEIKNKYKGIVEKRRIKLLLKEFYQYQETGQICKNEQIMKELDYYFRYFHLKPVIYIAYDRVSYRGRDNQNLRIIFDSNLRSRRDNLGLEFGEMVDKYFDEEYYIMEIKTLDSMPLWLVSVLSRLKIYPTSFSKYGKIYEKEKKRKRKYLVRRKIGVSILGK